MPAGGALVVVDAGGEGRLPLVLRLRLMGTTPVPRGEVIEDVEDPVH